jgi:hypothetical protein
MQKDSIPMTVTAKTYRQNAANERAAASGQKLTNRQEMHERAALVWDDMAQRLEDTAQLAVVNAVAKAQRRATEADAPQ